MLELDAGERDAIALAQQYSPVVLLLVDDMKARIEAERRGVSCIGTIGIIRSAAIKGLLDLPTVMASLQKTNFRCDNRLIQAILEDSDRRKSERQN